MAKSAVIKCPECGCRIEVNLATGKVFRHRTKGEREDADERFKSVIEDVGRRREEADALFDKAKQDTHGRQSELDKAFQEKLKKTREEGDDSPPPGLL